MYIYVAQTVREKMHCVWYDHFVCCFFVMIFVTKKGVNGLKRERKRFWINEKEINIKILFFVMKQIQKQVNSKVKYHSFSWNYSLRKKVQSVSILFLE
jgi:hypothetical protein